MRVVVTRPQDRAGATAAQLRSRGHEPLLLPLSKARHLISPDQYTQIALRSPSAIALTSAEALRALNGMDISSLLATPLFAVGRKTAAAAEEAGFLSISIADGDGASLAGMIAHKAPEDLVYLTGRPRSPTFETALAAQNISCRVVECYEMVSLTPDPDDILAILDPRPDAILFHSRETARMFFDLPLVAENLTALTPNRIICLSARVSDVVPAVLQNRIAVAAKPDETSLLAVL